MQSIDEIKQKAVPIARQYGIEKLGIFGSYAKGKATEKSDIDFVVEKGKVRGLQFYAFVDSLEAKLGLPVDVLTYEQLPETLFMDDVLRDEVPIYG
jgi:predicted nucleotidyltransferase